VNAERLHAIALALLSEMGQTDQLGHLNRLSTAMRQSVSDPAQPQLQQAVADTRSQLDTALAGAPSDQFSPAWRQALDELGIADVFGAQLRAAVRTILERNEVTPAAAATELEGLAARVNETNNALTNTVNAFGFFGIGHEELAPGEYEVGFLIPRLAVRNEIETLGTEFVQIKRILNPLVELATGSRPELQVRSISSSAFQVFLTAPGPAALMIAIAFERVLGAYEKIMNIRVAYKTLQDSGSSADALEAVAEDMRTKIVRDIEEIVEGLLTQAVDGIVEARLNELRNELNIELRALANRIDRGYGFEVRAGELPAPAPDAKPEDATVVEARRIADELGLMERRLGFMNLTGESILELPEGTNGSEPADADEGA
jgi:hypothetical protein